MGYRVSLSADYPPMAVPLKLDIITDDKITPKEIEYQFKLLLEDRNISVLAYNLETILAKLQYSNIEPNALKAALKALTEKRGSSEVVVNLMNKKLVIYVNLILYVIHTLAFGIQ